MLHRPDVAIVPPFRCTDDGGVDMLQKAECQEPMMKASDELIMMKNVTIFYGKCIRVYNFPDIDTVQYVPTLLFCN